MYEPNYLFQNNSGSQDAKLPRTVPHIAHFYPNKKGRTMDLSLYVLESRSWMISYFSCSLSSQIQDWSNKKGIKSEKILIIQHTKRHLLMN